MNQAALTGPPVLFLLRVQFFEIGDDGGRVVGSGIHVGHQHVSGIQWLAFSLKVDIVWIVDKFLEQLFVVLIHDMREVRTTTAEVAASTTKPRECLLPASR